MNSVNATLRDRILLRTHYLSRFETSQLKDLLKTLESAHKSVLDKLRTAPDIAPKNDQWNRGQLETLLKEIDGIYEAASQKMGDQLKFGMQGLAKTEAEWAVATMAKTIPVSVDLLTPSPAQVWAAVTTSPMDRGHIMAEMMDAYDAGTKNRIKAAIRQGCSPRF